MATQTKTKKPSKKAPKAKKAKTSQPLFDCWGMASLEAAAEQFFLGHKDVLPNATLTDLMEELQACMDELQNIMDDEGEEALLDNFAYLGQSWNRP